MDGIAKIILVFFAIFNYCLVPVAACCPKCPVKGTMELTDDQRDLIANPASQAEIARLQQLSFVDITQETDPIVEFTNDQDETVIEEFPEYFRTCSNGNRIENNTLDPDIECEPALPPLQNERTIQPFRKKRSSVSMCTASTIATCTPVQSYVQAIFAFDFQGRVVQLFQPNGMFQITIEETCSSSSSVTGTPCCERVRYVSAVVVTFTPSVDIKVIDIQISCCTATQSPQP
ncbi:uncharacterized protein [Apostichopus japonicus]|uniref:uncharacterized protein n=1 Tax=Stichopus japonicus TaxID=307972 RepID=UPI003AB2FB1A